MANNPVKFTLDLDIKDFTEQGLKAKGVLESLGSEENLSGLVEGLVKTGAILGTVGLAAFSFKKALDFTLEAESIRKVEQQFGTLAAQAGISAKALKEGMEDASKGLVTTGDLLETANKAIIAMGSSAAKLPQVMELARKATQVFGGDIKANFDNLTTALTNGNAKMLKQYGIIVDSDKAIREYAKANGLAANELSEAGRRQAIMNAALEQGEKAFKNVDGNMSDATNTLTLLKNTVSETAELFVLAFEKTMGPAVRSLLTGLKDFATSARQYLTGVFGEGLEQNQVQIQQTEEHLKALQIQLKILKEEAGEQGFFSKVFEGNREARIEQLNAQIEATTGKLEELRKKNEQIRAEEGKGGLPGAPKQGPDSNVNVEAQLENERKFQAQLTAIRRETLQNDALNVQSFAQIQAVLNEQQLIDEQLHQQKIQEIKNSTSTNERQKAALVAAEDARYKAQMTASEQKLGDERRKLLDQYQKNSTGVFNGIGRAYSVMLAKQKADQTDWGKKGEQTLQSFQANAVSAFSAMGKAAIEGQNIAEAAAKASLAVILGTVGDRAIAEGSVMMLSGLWPPNPIALGAGAGLIALGGALKAASGGILSSMSPSGGGAGGGQTAVEQDPCPLVKKVKSCDSSSVDESDASMGENASPDMAAMERRQKSVNIQIAGNYFDTDTSRRQLMEMIRAETDATDFTYNRIGVG